MKSAIGNSIVNVSTPLYQAIRTERDRTGVPMKALLAAAWDHYVSLDAERTPLT